MNDVATGRAPSRPAPPGMPRILPHLIYDDVDRAIAWLTAVVGFRERMSAHHAEPDGSTSRAQLEFAEGVVTIGRPSVHGASPRGGSSSMLYVYVDDVAAHCAHARARGAEIVTPVHEHAGDLRYQLVDPEGRQWMFAQRVSW